MLCLELWTLSATHQLSLALRESSVLSVNPLDRTHSTSLPPPPPPALTPWHAELSVGRSENFYALVNKSVKFNADERKFTTLQIKLDFYLNKLHFMRSARMCDAVASSSSRNNKQATAIICTGIWRQDMWQWVVARVWATRWLLYVFLFITRSIARKCLLIFRSARTIKIGASKGEKKKQIIF